MVVFKLCGDLVYVILFPQLVMVVHFDNHINTYGSFIGFCVGLLVRLLGGEPYINIPAMIHYPYYDAEKGQQNFPFRTMAMLCSFSSIVIFSFIIKKLFKKGILPKRFDVSECFFYEESKECLEEERRRTSSECESSLKLIDGKAVKGSQPFPARNALDTNAVLLSPNPDDEQACKV